MGKKDRLSRDQRRKAKLAKEARRAGRHESLAYTGNKYKTAALVPVVLRTETAIFEAYVMTGRTLTDRHVKSALEKLVLRMREGPLPPPEQSDRMEIVPGQEEDLITRNIRRNWHDLFESSAHPGSENLIGILRTLLGSIDVWTTRSPDSRGYLHFLEGFLRKTGVSVTAVSGDMEPLPAPPEPPLLQVGRDWLDGDPQARAEFRAMAEEMLASGQAETVVEVCQELIGEISETTDEMKELSTLSVRAQRLGRPGLR